MKRFASVYSWQEYIINEPVLRIFQNFSGNQVNMEYSSQDLIDSDENKISKGTFQVELEENKVAVAHHILVTPAYLIEIEGRQNVSNFVKNISCIKFNVRRFTEETNDLPLS